MTGDVEKLDLHTSLCEVHVLELGKRISLDSGTETITWMQVLSWYDRSKTRRLAFVVVHPESHRLRACDEFPRLFYTSVGVRYFNFVPHGASRERSDVYPAPVLTLMLTLVQD